MRALLLALLCVSPVLGVPITEPPTPSPVQAPCKSCTTNLDCDAGEICETTRRRKLRFGTTDGCCLTRTVNGTGHTGPSEFCATSI